MAENLNTRVTRLEEFMGRAFTAIEALAEKEAKLDDLMVLLTEAQIKTEQARIETEQRIQESRQETERLRQETERRFQETERRRDETEQLMKRHSGETDLRIEKLVTAIGEMLRNGGKR
jgi:hypothetical protein